MKKFAIGFVLGALVMTGAFFYFFSAGGVCLG